MNKFEEIMRHNMTEEEQMHCYLIANGFIESFDTIGTFEAEYFSKGFYICITIDIHFNQITLKKIAYPTKERNENVWYTPTVYKMGYADLNLEKLKRELNRCFEYYDFETLDNEIEEE